MSMIRTASLALLLAVCAPGCGGKSQGAATTTKPATTKILVNVNDRGVGLDGNDPVAYATDNAVVPGTESNTSTFGGATYQFGSAEHKAAFDAGPAKAAPQYGGYCAFAASQNRLSPSDPSVFLIYKGQLLVFTNEDYRQQFQQDPAGNKAKADANWPGLVSRFGK